MILRRGHRGGNAGGAIFATPGSRIAEHRIIQAAAMRRGNLERSARRACPQASQNALHNNDFALQSKPFAYILMLKNEIDNFHSGGKRGLIGPKRQR
jgi:hypothetical protein